MVLQLEDLLAPVSDESPTGADLFEDPGRQQLEQSFEEEAASVDWRPIIEQIGEQSARSKDVWLGVYLARAGAQMGSMAHVVLGAQMTAGLFETYWATLHPSLDEYGFQGRKGPCESLAKIGPFIGPLRRVALYEHPRLGSFSGEDFQRFAVQGDSADGFGLFRAAVAEAEEGALQSVVDQLDSLHDAIRRIDGQLMRHADGDTGTDFALTYETIESIRSAVIPYSGIEVHEQNLGNTAGASTSADKAEALIPGRVDSRDDVIRTLDLITDYYERREPASPVPVAVRRIRGWVSMDFMAILRDIAPNSVSEAGSVLLARPEDEESEY